MTKIQQSGAKLDLRPVEKMIPIIDWFAHLNSIAKKCIMNSKKKIINGGYKYTDIDYWRVLIYGVMTYLNTNDASNELNDELWKLEFNKKTRGKKSSKKELGGKYPRFERKVPNESQVNTFIRKLPDYIKKNLVEMIFKAQIDVALELNLITKEIEVYIDYTDKPYYGNDRYPTNPEIYGLYNGPGTNRGRKYLGIMLSSRGTRLFVGLNIIKKGDNRALIIDKAIEILTNYGFTIKRVEGDREFSNYDIIGKLKQKDIPYTGTMKKNMPIKLHVEDYLDGKCKAVVPHILKPNQYTRYKFGDIPVIIIMKTDPGKRMAEVRKDLKNGTITRKEAREKIHVFITTEKPPKNKKKLVRWGLRITQLFRKRWRIETGFRDLNRVFPTSHARSNESKRFWMGMRMFAYNAWQIQKSLCKKLRNVPKVWKKGTTQRRFSIIQSNILILA